MKQFIHKPTAKEMASDYEAEERERRKAIAMGNSEAVDDSTPQERETVNK
jgi:hypothetical protein